MATVIRIGQTYIETSLDVAAGLLKLLGGEQARIVHDKSWDASEFYFDPKDGRNKIQVYLDVPVEDRTPAPVERLDLVGIDHRFDGEIVHD